MAQAPLGEHLAKLGQPRNPLRVQISYELIRLLSEQLYSSPAKAIEELVVNAWDADARNCEVYVPSALPEPIEDVPEDFIAVFDDGTGMDEAGLQDLWHVGLSRKRKAEADAGTAGKTVRRRLQIGKFGIGKLATYAIARRVTYVTRTPKGEILGLSVDFDDFEKTEEQRSSIVEPLDVPVTALEPESLLKDERFLGVAKSVQLTPDDLVGKGQTHWTLVILEHLRDEAATLTDRKLQWVFSTAMPLESDFRLRLNGNTVESADEAVEWRVDFDVSELPDERLSRISELTGEKWERKDGTLVSPSFPSGVHGRVRVARQSLYRPTTKRADLGRSHGFFVKVRDRLVNDEDPLFGVRPRSFQIWNRFAATVHADDLDAKITAAREGIEESEEERQFAVLLNSLFGEARARFEQLEREAAEDERRKKDGARNFVGASLFEHPIADVLVGAERDPEEEWFYLEIEPDEERITELITSLYLDVETRRQYVYTYDALGEDEPLVRFEPDESLFVLNDDHPIVDEFIDETGRGKELVELLATGEALLEVYLREADVPPSIARNLLERRDSLLRSLASDRVFSPATLAKNLRAARNHDKELEAALVAAMRLLGFSAEHISNAGEPDGIAIYNDGRRDWVLTLEAKSSDKGKAPSLGALDFAGLVEHMDGRDADGCLLIAPAYPGEAQTKESAAARRGNKGEISCWTIEDLARVVEAAEHRHISAVDVLDIVKSKFAPKNVKAAVDALLAEDRPTPLELRTAVVDEVIDSYTLVPDADLTVASVAVGVNKRLREEGREPISEAAIRTAVTAVVEASRGALHLSENKETVFVRVDPDEVRRRLVHTTQSADGPPRRKGVLRKD
jgi:Histidine kinase-, DNA gyrase B-, and HSP90-like ATPase